VGSHVSFRPGLLGLLVAASLITPGCSGDSGKRYPAATVRVSERDFAIKAPKRVRAGNMDLAVRNRGPDAHELIVVRAPRGKLPFRADGATVDEEALEHATPGALEPGEPGGLRHLRVRLSPGRYELICNMAGHYMGGMSRRLVVQ
jgi:uncharacterized cupredoxin-like copper-binding protein